MRIWSEKNLTPNSPLLTSIYLQSKINLDDYYKTCAIMASESSNNQQIIDKLEYYVFNNLMVYFKEIVESKSEKTENNGENPQTTAQNQLSSTMKSAKSMMKPNMSNFKSFKNH
jgi:hypothetical protein